MGDNGADTRQMIGSYKIPQARNLPLPVISRRPSSPTMRRAACGVTSSVLATIPADTNGFAITSSTSSGNLDDIREFTTPEMFAEIKMSIAERKGAQQETDVAQLEAEVLDVAEEASRYIVSVRFHGLISEERGTAAQPFDEIWHMTKPTDGSRGWVIAGIQQVQ